MAAPKPRPALILAAALAFGAACKRAPVAAPAETPELAAPAPSSTLVVTPLDTATTGYTNEMQAAALSKETVEMGIEQFSRDARAGDGPPRQSVQAPYLTDEDRKQRTKDRKARLARARALTLEYTRQRRNMDADRDKSVMLLGSTAGIISGRESGNVIGVALDAPGVWSGEYGGAVETGDRVIEAAAVWTELWGRLSRETPPEVDFSKNRIVAIFAGPRPTPGYRAHLIGIVAEPTRYVVRWYEEGPAPDEITGDGASAPFLLVSVPKDDQAVRCEKIRRAEGPKRK